MIELLDTTVLSNFAVAESIQLLPKILSDEVVTVEAVIQEFKRGIDQNLVPDANLKWLRVIGLSERELYTYEQLTLRLDAGEAACLAIAVHRAGKVFTDDADARRIASELHVPVSGR